MSWRWTKTPGERRGSTSKKRKFTSPPIFTMWLESMKSRSSASMASNRSGPPLGNEPGEPGEAFDGGLRLRVGDDVLGLCAKGGVLGECRGDDPRREPGSDLERPPRLAGAFDRVEDGGAAVAEAAVHPVKLVRVRGGGEGPVALGGAGACELPEEGELLGLAELDSRQGRAPLPRLSTAQVGDVGDRGVEVDLHRQGAGGQAGVGVLAGHGHAADESGHPRVAGA